MLILLKFIKVDKLERLDLSSSLLPCRIKKVSGDGYAFGHGLLEFDWNTHVGHHSEKNDGIKALG